MTDSPVVGSASFELRATKDKIPADLEEARRVVLEAAKKTEDELAGVVGSGTEKGSKKAAAALKEPKTAGEEAGKAIRDAMGKAGAEIGEAVTKGATKAKQELDELARKAREVQQIRLATPTVPTAATHTLTTNPINGAQSWAPNDLAGPRSVRSGSGMGVAAPELKQTAEAAKEAKEAVQDIAPAADAGAAGLGRLSKGSLATGVAIGALVTGALVAAKVSYDFGRATLQMAADLNDSAKRIGVSTDALQEWRYVAQRSGEDAKAADGAIEAFGNKLAQASAGLSKEALDAFKALGFSQDQLRSFRDVEMALDAVVDRVGELKNESDRAAIAEKLGLGPLASALREGSEETARLRDEAVALGFVIDAELIQKGADAQQTLGDLAQIIGVQMAEAFLDLSDEVIAFTGHLIEAIKKLNEFSNRYSEAKARNADEGQSTSWINNFGRALGGDFTENLPWVRSRNAPGSYADAAANARANPDPRLEDPDDPENLYRMSDRDIRRLYRGNLPSGRTQLTPVQPRGRQDRSEEREARRAERVQEEINRAKARALQIAQDDLLTVQEQYDLRQRELAIERAGEDADLKSRLARKDLLQGEYEQLTSQNAINRALEDRIGKDILSRDLADERLAQERLIGDLTRDLLSLQSGAARTAAERRQIELQLLELAQDRARKELLNSDEYRKASPEEKAAAIAAQDQVFGWQVSAVNRSTMSPLEEWRDRSLNDAKEVEEAYERVAANGLDALNDGLVDAIMNSRSLGETFSQVAKQILADLLSISVRRGITEPLAGLLFGGESGGGTGSMFAGFGSWLKGKIPGFSSGVTNFSGGLAYVHQGEVLANLAPGTDVIPAHAVGGMGGGGPVRVIVETNDDRFNAYVDDRVAPQASAAFTGARQTVPSDMARTSKYTLSGRR